MDEDDHRVTTRCRGIRGATLVGTPAELDEAATELVSALLRANGCARRDVAAVVFTLTDDMAGLNPAAALRAQGWGNTALLMMREHSDALANCLRVLLLVNTPRADDEVQHVYLRGSAVLRPDLPDVLVALEEATA